MRHFVIVGILVILVAFLTHAGLVHQRLMPVEASAQAVGIDWMWDLQVAAMSFLFALIVVPMVYSLVVFRRRKGDQTDGEHIEGNTNLEIAWTAIPLFVVVIFSYLGAGNLADTLRPSPNELVVKVTGFQWGWRFEYPEYGITTSEMYVPVNQALHLKMESTDVIHSFWVPEFRVKQDLVPGRVTDLRITPTLAGPYKVRCAELCGTSHYAMEQPVVVVDETTFAAWVADQQAVAAQLAATPEGRGQKIYETFCKACHSLNGAAGNGPTWRGLYGSEVEFVDGTKAVADDAYILESIQNPTARVVAGYPPMNFNYEAAGITVEQLNDILAYIKTLK